MVGLGGNIIIHNLDITVNIDQWLSIENIMFYNGKLIVFSATQLSIENVMLYNELVYFLSFEVKRIRQKISSYCCNVPACN